MIGGRSQSTKANLVNRNGFNVDHLVIVVFVDINILRSGIGIGGDGKTIENAESFREIKDGIGRFGEKNRGGGGRERRVV